MDFSGSAPQVVASSPEQAVSRLFLHSPPARQLFGEEGVGQLRVGVLAQAGVAPPPAVQVVQAHAAQLVGQRGQHHHPGWGALHRPGRWALLGAW